MATNPTQLAAAKKWDDAHMACQTVKVRRELLDSFKAACAARGDRVNTILRETMENYVKEYAKMDKEQADRDETSPDGQN